MQYRRLGKSGLEVSIVCLGTMMFGDRTDAREANAIVADAATAGVNFIDTADVYANGASETITGAAIRDQRSRWILATKVGNAMGGDDNRRPWTGGSSRRWIIEACNASLARLGTDFIDIYYLHKDDPDTPLEESVAAMGSLVDAGKIRYFGLSNFRGWRIAEVMRCCERAGVAPPVVCQPYYNLLNRMPEVEILAACDHYGIGVATYSPIARGVLTGKYATGVDPRRLARRSQRPAPDADRVSRRVIRDRAAVAGARGENGPHAGAIRARLAVGEPDRDVRHRRAANARAMAGLRGGDRHAVERRRRGARRRARAPRTSIDTRLQRSAISDVRPAVGSETTFAVCSAKVVSDPAFRARGESRL